MAAFANNGTVVCFAVRATFAYEGKKVGIIVALCFYPQFKAEIAGQFGFFAEG